MDEGLEQYLRSNPAIVGSLVADANGLLVSAKGGLQHNSEIKAGHFTSIARLAQALPSSSDALCEGVTVTLETVAEKQLVLRRVGDLTVVVQTDERDSTVTR